MLSEIDRDFYYIRLIIRVSPGLNLSSCTISFFLNGLVFSKTDVKNAKNARFLANPLLFFTFFQKSILARKSSFVSLNFPKNSQQTGANC